MFLIRKPTTSFIDRFIDQSRDLTLSYEKAGITATDEAPVREYLAVIGHGQADFERAKLALVEWKQFDLGWVQLFPSPSSIAVGTNVAVLIRHLGFWSLNGCRVVYQLAASPTRFGYAYGTLPTHAECGEELFEVFLDSGNGDVIYRIRVSARLQSLFASLGAPYVKMLQARFRRDSAAVMKRASSSLAS